MLGIKRTAKFSSDKPDESRKFLILFILGFFIILAGIIILIFAAMLFGEGSANFGVLIFIGPIPIIIGYDPEAP
jgi:uncharacterized membrane protein